MNVLQQNNTVVATFQPKRVDDLKPGAASLIGQSGEWRAIWIIDDSEEYNGQWAMQPLDDLGHRCVTCDPDEGFSWVPECDLHIQYMVPSGCKISLLSRVCCNRGCVGCVLEHEET